MLDDGDTGEIERVRFLARATSRVRVMQYLASFGPATQRELRQHLDGSRTTIARAVRSLCEAGWVDDGDDGYRLTHTGAVVAEEFSSLLETIRRTEELSSFLRWFPADEDVPDFVSADDVEVTTSDTANPYAPAKKQAEILERADDLRILLPSVDPDATETISEEVVGRDFRVETIIANELEPVFESEQFAPLIAEMVETGRSDVLVAPGPLPFYLGLAGDGLVQIGVEDGEGFPRALLETPDEDVRAWAEDVYESYRSEARLKPISGL
ncbi:transcriptional regulator FilR1 domain-containing protein [Halobellus sp. GM3]|uniref:transcriptional regulator FilR1 domain-containing protein n=1 Tax=Halobellus sp. GM3 TaxID=3458410 RepID=UPI00403E0D31